MDEVRCLCYIDYNACGGVFYPVTHAIETGEVVDVQFAHTHMNLLLMMLKFKHVMYPSTGFKIY